MIHILVGLDRNKRNIFLKKLASENIISVPLTSVSQEVLRGYASSASLFGDIPSILIEGIISESDIVSSVDILKELNDSQTLFVFIEDKLTVSEEKKYTKYSTITHFDLQTAKKSTPKVNTFAIADAYGKHDKIGTWVLYRDAIEKGTEPEVISGMLFWKIKQMILANPKSQNIHILKRNSGELVSLYHKAHKGERDFVVGLEQFILTSLS
ncbi:hypothetical protein K8Q96_00330 [Candidatus Nomurabacteria bacterium]|nr:hypothetical protein [Candidatus Nomurabacteria bacterium]